MTFSIDRILDVLAIIFGGGGVISAILSIRRTKAQNTLDLSTAWEQFAAPLMKRLTELEKRVVDQENEIEDLRGWAERLVRQVLDLGGTPAVFVKRRGNAPPTRETE